MTEEEAVAVIGRTPLIEVTTAAMQDIKRMRDQCLNAGIPAMMERPKGNCGSSWGTKLALLVREADIPKLQQLNQQLWLQSVAAEGNAPVVTDFTPNEAGDLPCPACGTAAPLDADGACTDCGLVLG